MYNCTEYKVQPGNSVNRHKSPKTLDSGTNFSQCLSYVLQNTRTCNDFQIYAWKITYFSLGTKYS